MIHDVIIVGAGASGLFCATEPKRPCRRHRRGMIRKKRGRPAKPHPQPLADLSMALKLRNGTTEFLP